MRSLRRSALRVALLLAFPALVAAQAPQRAGVSPVSAAANQRDPGAFFLETLGATLGSLAGMGAVALASNCDVEDLGCLLITIGAGGAAGAIGATIGTNIAARGTGSARSVAGAALGAIVGTGVGLGVHYLLNRGSDRNIGDKVVIPIFVVSQGTLAAIASRIVGTRPNN